MINPLVDHSGLRCRLQTLKVITERNESAAATAKMRPTLAPTTLSHSCQLQEKGEIPALCEPLGFLVRKVRVRDAPFTIQSNSPRLIPFQVLEPNPRCAGCDYVSWDGPATLTQPPWIVAGSQPLVMIMISAAACRRHARDCVEMADRASPQQCQELLDLAETWFELALEATERERRVAVLSIKLH